MFNSWLLSLGVCVVQCEERSPGSRREDLYCSEHVVPLLRRRSSGCFSASLLLTQFPRAFTPSSLGSTFFQVSHYLANSKSHPLSSGYTVTWLPSRGLMSLLAAGAPRFQHVGRVLLFQESKDKRRWSQIQEINGTQVSMTHGRCRSGAGMTRFMLPAAF